MQKKTLPFLVLTLIKRRIEPDDFPFSPFTLVGVVFLFVHEVLAMIAALQRRIINTFSTFKSIFSG